MAEQGAGEQTRRRDWGLRKAMKRTAYAYIRRLLRTPDCDWLTHSLEPRSKSAYALKAWLEAKF